MRFTSLVSLFKFTSSSGTSDLISGLGVAPIDFRKDEVVEIRGVKMTSAKTQLPYEYYSLPFCQPEGGVAYETLNLGEVLRGDRIVNTAYDVRMDQRIDCKIICEQEITEDQAEQIIQRVNENYFVHLLADNLPAVTCLLYTSPSPRDRG